jgi:predicted DNA-binding transcriptional regulator AlpA
MRDPYPDKAVLTAQEVAHLLSMEVGTFRRFLAEEPTFPQAIRLGKHTSKRSDRARWRKEDVLIWVLRQPPDAPE